MMDNQSSASRERQRMSSISETMQGSKVIKVKITNNNKISSFSLFHIQKSLLYCQAPGPGLDQWSLTWSTWSPTWPNLAQANLVTNLTKPSLDLGKIWARCRHYNQTDHPTTTKKLFKGGILAFLGAKSKNYPLVQLRLTLKQAIMF